MLSTAQRLELTDIVCRMITDDAPEVTLEERIWVQKLIDHNASARGIYHALIH